MSEGDVVVGGITYSGKMLDKWAQSAWKASRENGVITTAGRLDDFYGHELAAVIVKRIYELRARGELK